MSLIKAKPPRWYREHNGVVEACYSMPKKSGNGTKEPTIADARELGLLPSVTTILGVLAKPGLERWKIEQAIHSALTLPRLEGEGEDAFARRVVQDMDAQAAKAAEFGTRVHDAIAGYVTSMSNNGQSYVDIPHELIPFMDSFREWAYDNIEEVHAVEKVVGGKHCGYAGRLDLDCTLRGVGRSVVDFKGLATDTPLATPSGWTTMGDVKVGDLVFGRDGNSAKVIGKSGIFNRPCYRITFDDASTIVCDNEHWWKIEHWRYGRGGRKTKAMVVSADELYHAIQSKKSNHHFVIPNAAPLQMPDANLPVDPYLFGFWLGDGDKSQALFTMPPFKLGVADYVKSLGLPVTFPKSTGRCDRFYIKGLTKVLRSMGVCPNKHVPTNYARASFQQRLALLRGLMDSDGTWNPIRKQAVFGNTDQRLCESVYELVVSLGWRCSYRKYRAKGFGIECDAYIVPFTPSQNPFFLNSHNAPRFTLPTSYSRFFRRLIKKVEKVNSVPTQCIEVDSEDNLYLAGNQMVPTHNTQAVKEGKEPMFYRDWNAQLSAYALAGADGARIMSIVIDSRTPGPVHTKLWTVEERLGGERMFHHCFELWKLINDYDPEE